MFEASSPRRSWSEYERTLDALIRTSSEVRFRVNADWSSLQQLDGGDFIPDSEAESRDWLESYIPPEDRDAVRAEIARAIRTKTTYLIEHRVNRLDGTVGWAFARAVPLLDEAGYVAEWLGTASDITRHKLAETALRDRETRLRLAVGAGHIGEWELDLETNTSVRALRHDQIFGYAEPVEDWGLDTFLDHVVPEERAATEAAFERAAETGAGWNFQCRIRRRCDGAVRWITACSAPQLDDAGRVVKLFGMVQDITDQKAAEIALRELNETLERQVTERTSKLRLYGDIIQSSAAPICAFDGDHRLIAFNKAHSDEFFRLSDHRVRIGEAFLDLLPRDQAAAMRASMDRALAGEAYTVTGRFGDPALARPDWEISYSPLRDATGHVVGAFSYAKDISERLRAEAELASVQETLRQSQKMEAVGQLTGGVAHDFNNLLTVIKSSTDLLRRPNLAEDRRIRYVEAISDAVERAAKLTGQLLAFARRQSLMPEVFDVGRSIAAVSDMIGTLTGSRVKVSSRIEPYRDGVGREMPCLVDADPSQFDTALVNMVANARDAMGGEGRLDITVRPTFRIPAVRAHPSVPGDFIAVSVADTGTGIPGDVLERIFEPFFTTKAVGQGTGLGLSQVFGFAKQSGGEVVVESEVGHGTTFTMYLPRARERSPAAPNEREPPPLAEGHGTCVLVVEDNLDVGAFANQALAELGYETVWATDAVQALAELERVPFRFEVVFSDVVMPGMNGIALAREIRGRYPRLPVVLTSGYSDVLAEEGSHGFELLRKPYSVADLSRVLRLALRKAAREVR